jgi:hypothetical protein
MCVSRMSRDGQEVRLVMKQKVIHKKPPVLPQELDEDQIQPGWPDTDGLSGEGAESALAHLRDQENKRIDRPHKGE